MNDTPEAIEARWQRMVALLKVAAVAMVAIDDNDLQRLAEVLIG